MEFLPGEYVLGVWFAQKTNSGDVVLCVRKKPRGWQAEYLIRCFEGARVTKTTRKFMLDPQESEDATWIRMNRVFNTVRKMYPDFHEYVDIRGDYYALIFKLAMTDWVQFRQENDDIVGVRNVKKIS